MSESKVSIFSAALRSLGSAEITSFSSQSSPLSESAFDNLLDEGLVLLSPNGARVTASFAALSPGVFSFPELCLSVLEVTDPAETLWRVEGRSVIAAGVTTLTARYVQHVDDMALLAPDARGVISAFIASRLAMSITQSQTTANTALIVYERLLASARHRSSLEGFAVESMSWVGAFEGQG